MSPYSYQPALHIVSGFTLLSTSHSHRSPNAHVCNPALKGSIVNYKGAQCKIAHVDYLGQNYTLQRLDDSHIEVPWESPNIVRCAQIGGGYQKHKESKKKLDIPGTPRTVTKTSKGVEYQFEYHDTPDRQQRQSAPGWPGTPVWREARRVYCAYMQQLARQKAVHQAKVQEAARQLFKPKEYEAREQARLAGINAQRSGKGDAGTKGVDRKVPPCSQEQAGVAKKRAAHLANNPARLEPGGTRFQQFLQAPSKFATRPHANQPNLASAFGGGLEDDWEGTRCFRKEMDDLLAQAPRSPCVSCGEMWPTAPQPMPVGSGHPTAGRCEACISSPCNRDYNWQNMMHPGVVPVELQGLTDLEELLIARTSVFMSVYRLKHGFHGYKGHVLNVSQAACTLYNCIPRKWDELSTVAFVDVDKAGHKKSFKVNKARVFKACQWLKAHNLDFADVTIDDAHIPAGENEEDEVDVANLMPTVEVDVAGPGQDACVGAAATANEDAKRHGQSLGESSSMLATAPTLSEVEKVVVGKVAKGQLKSDQEVWPERGDAVDERTVGLMNKAFPSLFPGGHWQRVVNGVPVEVSSWHPGLESELQPVPVCEVPQCDPDTLIDFQHGCDKNVPRMYAVATKDIWCHLMRHHSGRFQSHLRWRYWAFNTLMRKNNLTVGKVFADKELEGMTVEDLNEAIENGDRWASDTPHHIALHITSHFTQHRTLHNIALHITSHFTQHRTSHNIAWHFTSHRIACHVALHNCS